MVNFRFNSFNSNLVVVNGVIECFTYSHSRI